jgi:flagellar hook-basal body complex protein FliE
MTEINAAQLLSQMRALRGEIEAINGTSSAPGTTKPTGFGDTLSQAINSVNEAQMTAKKLKADYAAETGDASLAEVMIAAQKADLSFRAMTEVRNKLVTAYQEIMNMPV